MFQCVADGKDHTPCCSERRVPPLCQELCSGNELFITFEYLSCLAYMSDISSCMLENYKLLPSNPVNFRISNIHSDFAVLHWDRPEELGETVIDYVVRVQQLTLAESDYEEEISQFQKHEQTIKDHANNPFVLENLDGDSSYEVIVEAVNVNGVGEPSTGIVFRTMSNAIQDLLEKLPTYDPSSCCLKSGINSKCKINIKLYLSPKNVPPRCSSVFLQCHHIQSNKSVPHLPARLLQDDPLQCWWARPSAMLRQERNIQLLSASVPGCSPGFYWSWLLEMSSSDWKNTHLL